MFYDESISLFFPKNDDFRNNLVIYSNSNGDKNYVTS